MGEGRQILHVDMDAFFASVEQRDNPSLRGQPVVVGGPSRRGVVAAASYEARRFGVRSAMPLVEALRRCPEAVVVPGRHRRYAAVSDEVFAVFRRYTPLVEGLSVDEAFLDVTASQALFGDGAAIAARIKREVRAETGLTASAGVASSKFVAKVASDLEKPDGLVVVAAGAEAAFLAPLPIERMWGVGPVGAARLRAAGLRTIGDLAGRTLESLARLLGSAAASMQELARGVDPRAVHPMARARSLGAEDTFERDVTTEEQVRIELLGQASRVAQRLVAEGLSASTLTVKIKWADFTLRTRQTRLREPAADTDTLHRAACGLLARFPSFARGVRLTGITVSELLHGPPPPLLFPDPVATRRREVERTVRTLADRFGETAVRRAALLGAGHRDQASPTGPPRRTRA